jgi:hypothetical protein
MVYVKKYKSQKEKSPVNPRKDSITLEEAQSRFNEYYNARSKSKVGRIRAKVGDIRYNKSSPKFLLRPNEPGSAKYLLPEGPRTFDMVGVDYFPETDEYTTIEDPEVGLVKVSLKGTPKLKSGESYTEHFKKKYDERKVTWEDGKELINEYWDEKYKPSVDADSPLKRNRRALKEWNFKKEGFVTESYFILGKNELFFTYKGNIYYLDSNMRVYDSNHQFINKLHNMDDSMIEELIDKRYVRRGRGGYPVWADNIYNWTIYYKYVDNNNVEHKVKLDMKNMNVYDEATNELLADWNSFLTSNSLDYKKLYPYDILHNGEAVEKKIPTKQTIVEPELEFIEEESVEPASVVPSPIVPASVAPSPIVPASVAPSPIVPASVAPSPIAPVSVAPSPIVPAVAPSPIVPASVAPSPVVSTSVTPSPIVPASVATPSPIVPVSVAPSPIASTASTPSTEPSISQVDFATIPLEITQSITPEILSPLEPPKTTTQISEQPTPKGSPLLKPINLPEMTTEQLIDELGFKLITENGEQYYYNETDKIMITKQSVDELIQKTGYDLYDILIRIDEPVFKNALEFKEPIKTPEKTVIEQQLDFIPFDEDEFIDEEEIETSMKTPEASVDEEAKQALELIKSPVKTPESSVDEEAKEALELIKSPVKTPESSVDEEAKEALELIKSPMKTPEASVDEEAKEALELIKSPVKTPEASVDEEAKEALELINEPSLSPIEQDYDEDEEYDEDGEYEDEEYDKDGEYEDEEYDEDGEYEGDDGEYDEDEEEDMVQPMKWVKKTTQPEMPIITPSIEHERYKGFKDIIDNLTTGGVKRQDVLSSVTEMIYDEFNKKPKQDDPVFPTLEKTPTLKKIDNNLLKTEMNKLVNKLKKYQQDPTEVVDITESKDKYIMILKKNNKQVGDKIEISIGKYKLLKQRIQQKLPSISDSDINKIIWSLLYRYNMILPVAPIKFKMSCIRATDEKLPAMYNSMFHDLEKYIGSVGMC